MNDTDVSRKRLREERTLLLLTLAVIVLSAAASDLFFFRADLTEDRSFTISEAARSLRAQIPGTVSVTYYVSDSLAARHPGPGMVEDLLREFEAHARGRIRVSIRDPRENPGNVEALGVHPLQMSVDENGEARVATVYSGIVVEYLDDFRVIPSILDAGGLEYEMVKAIRSLVRGVVPVAALLEGDGDKDPEGDYRLLRAALARAGYEVRILSREAEVGPDVSVLFVLGNAALDAAVAYNLDRYLGSGGRAFVAARGVRVDADRGLRAEPLAENALLDLLDVYGVFVRQELVLDSSNLTVPFQTQTPQGGVAYKYVRYPHWIVTDRGNVLESHPAASRYSGLDLYWPSPLELFEREGLSYDPLVKSTSQAWKQTRNFATGPDQESLYREEEDSTRGQYLLAVAVSGKFPSAFEGRSNPRPGTVASESGAVPGRPGRLVVVGSSDFLTDLMSMSRSEYNASFAVRAADWLSSDDDMPMPATVRRIARLRPVGDDSARVRRIVMVYILNIAAIPALVVIYGLFRSFRRRREERATRGVSRTEGKGGTKGAGS